MRDRNVKTDGFAELSRGSNSGQAPNILPINQVSFAANTTFRGGFPHQRPGWVRRTLQFLDSSGVEDATLKANFEDNFFQGGGAGRLPEPYLFAGVGGRLFRIDVENGYKVSDISVTGDLGPSIDNQVWFTQAENYMVCQDGSSKALIYGAGHTRRAAVDEVPTGTAMAYGQGRLWVANGNTFVAGDAVYGPSGSAILGWRDSVLKFTENTYLAEGGFFGVPSNAGGITGMQFIPQVDKTLGDGPLMVFTPDAIYSVNVPADRTLWQNLTQPVMTPALLRRGGKGQDSIVSNNGDLFFRSDDGVRSFIMARRDFQTWGNTPISQEMLRVLERDDKNLLSYGSSVVFDNRLMMTVSPFRNFKHGIGHRGLAVMNFDVASSSGQKAPAVWEGLWTGIDILKLVVLPSPDRERCFAFVLRNDKVELWEMEPEALFDELDTPIQWAIETRSMAFSDMFEPKWLQWGELFFDSLAGRVTFDVDWRPDQYACWQDWHSWSECSKWHTYNFTDGTLEELAKQHRSWMRLPTPPETIESVSGRPYRQGYEFQFRFEVTGAARLLRFAAHASTREQEPFGEVR